MATSRVGRAKAKADIPAGDDAPGHGSVSGPAVRRRSTAYVIRRARRSLMDAVPDSVEALAENAKKGSVAHVKLLLQLVRLDEGELAPVVVQPQTASFVDSIFEAWVRESKAVGADGDSNTGGLRGNGR